MGLLSDRASRVQSPVEDMDALAAACVGPCEMGAYVSVISKTKESYQVPDHVRLMSDVIRDAVRKAVDDPQPMGGRIIFEMPPRHGKSELGSRAALIWALERWPELKLLHVSYEKDFSTKWGRKVKETFERYPTSFTTRVHKEKRAAGEWETTRGGGMACSGVGGPLTGRGADLMVIDDPVKNRMEANSQLVRDNLWDWFTSTAYTRIEPGGVCVVIMTRWHEDDLVGRILKSPDAAHWKRIVFPAIAEESDVLGRSPGAPLWPERYDVEALESIKRTTGSADWASLYQQRPSPAGGAVFQREYFRYARTTDHALILECGDGAPRSFLKTACRVFQTCDTAMKVGAENDYTAVMTLAITPEHDLVVLDVVRAKVRIPDQLSYVRAQRDRWESRGHAFMYQAVEDVGSGTALLAAAKQAGYPMKPLKHGSRDKVSRAAPAAILSENEGLYFSADLRLLEEFESELLVFPNGSNDDMVDCLAYGAELVGVRAGGSLFGLSNDEDLDRRYWADGSGHGLDGLRPTGGWGVG